MSIDPVRNLLAFDYYFGSVRYYSRNQFNIDMARLTIYAMAATLWACSDNRYQEEIPYAFFEDIIIQLDLPEYNDLSFDNGHIILNEGIRGIILFRVDASTYNAFEMVCTYHPHDACATINVHNSGLYLFCPCCGSTYSPETGHPTGGGPAEFPLRQYQTYLSGRTLTVTDEAMN